MEAKIKYKKREYAICYSIDRYLTSKGEIVRHTLQFGRVSFDGKSLEDVVNKFRTFLENGKKR